MSGEVPTACRLIPPPLALKFPVVAVLLITVSGTLFLMHLNGIELQRVSLGALRPDDVAVQMYVGRLDANNEIVGAESARMELVSDEGNGVYLFESPPTPWRASGMHGYTVRVMPDHPNLHHHYLPGLVAWAAGS